jgi:hypothetical protein
LIPVDKPEQRHDLVRVPACCYLDGGEKSGQQTKTGIIDGLYAATLSVAPDPPSFTSAEVTITVCALHLGVGQLPSPPVVELFRALVRVV